MGTAEKISTIRALLELLADRLNGEAAQVLQQIQLHTHGLEAEHRRELADLESRLREENMQLATELKSLLPQAAKERNEAREKARELEARNQALEARIKVLEPKAAAQSYEPKPMKIRQPISSQDFVV